MTEESGHGGAAVPVSRYVWSFVALVALTLTSFALSRLQLGAAETSVAIAIAALKVLIVALFFMRLRDEAPSSRLTGVAAFLFVTLLVVFAALDIITRP